jgi:sugar phosphate permease
VPGILIGGRIADRYASRVRGARVAIPAYCLLAGNTFFTISYLRLPFGPAFALEAIGLFFMTMAIPGLRAGLSDAIPANLRGAGFGAFNLVAVVLGGAGAPLVVSMLSDAFDNNLRTAFLIVAPVVYFGAFVLLRARDHLEADAMKIFQAVVTAMQEQQKS